MQEKVFAIDFDEKTVRVARTLNLIAGDGQSNVLHLNTLDWERWDEKINDEDWKDTYYDGWKKFKRFKKDKNNNRDFEFDILMANPPFAGDIKESRILAKYELARTIFLEKLKSENHVNIHDCSDREPTFPEFLGIYSEKIIKMPDGTFRKVKVQSSNKMGRDILFIERNLNFLKPGGRMAIVLPQGRFNNSSDKYVREYIAHHCRILAVVGLHGNVFKPHTGTKTSVLLVQKWDEKLCPKVDDYPIFFATMQEPSKDSSGDKIYLRKKDLPNLFKLKPEQPKPKQTKLNMVSEPQVSYVSTPKDLDEFVLDTQDHLIVKHDLFNHDGYTQDGIAEAFAEFAKKEQLSFF